MSKVTWQREMKITDEINGNEQTLQLGVIWIIQGGPM